MGRDKATLQFGPEKMLQRVVRLIGSAVDLTNIVVVAAPDQTLPELPRTVSVAHDAEPYQGPLLGLATGLIVLAGRVDAVYVSGCDVPLLVPAFVDRMFELLGDFEIAVPVDGRYHHPLAAVYRTTVLSHVKILLRTHRLAPRFLVGEVRTREIPVDELRDVDPTLGSLRNVNDPTDYDSGLTAAGFAPNPSC
jgi:molybdopterin-guanine dinucleotide biosynthesis protein A